MSPTLDGVAHAGLARGVVHRFEFLITDSEIMTVSLAFVLLWVLRVVYCVVTDPALSQRHDKISMMTTRHRDGPCRYRDGGGKCSNFTVTRGRPRWISDGHVS